MHYYIIYTNGFCSLRAVAWFSEAPCGCVCAKTNLFSIKLCLDGAVCSLNTAAYIHGALLGCNQYVF